LKRHALLAEQNPQALMADVLDHPLSDQEVGQLRKTPGRKWQVMILRPGQRDLLDLLTLREGERGWPPTPILRVDRVEPVGVEVVDDIPDPIGAGEGDLGDLGDRHALGAQQDHLGSAPGDHRPAPAAQDTQQPVAFSLVKLAHPAPVRPPRLLVRRLDERESDRTGRTLPVTALDRATPPDLGAGQHRPSP
jgi:hypothetical protein